MARGCAAGRLTVVTSGQMGGLDGSGDFDECDLPVEGLDLRGVWMFQLLCGGSEILVLVRLLPAVSGFLPAFLQLCVWLPLISGPAQLLSSWLQVDWPDEPSSFLVLEAQG